MVATTTRMALACVSGGGVKAGCIYGETDEFGHKAVTNVVNHYDYHATLFHLFGIDVNQLTVPRPGGQGSLLDGQPGHIVHDILA